MNAHVERFNRANRDAFVDARRRITPPASKPNSTSSSTTNPGTKGGARIHYPYREI
jgi:hypothetical protein